MGNGQDGIRISEGPKNTTIGGSIENANIIANNHGAGISLISPNDIFHEITFNSIFNNAGLGIDIFPFGANINDAGDNDNGPNQMMNYPVIDTIYNAQETGKLIIKGRIDTQNPELSTIHLYLSELDPSGYGEGKQYISTTISDNLGYWADTIQGISLTDFITATATNPQNCTSEFSMSRNSFISAKISIEPLNQTFTISPNPSNGNFIISCPNSGFISIYASIGNLVYSQKINNTLNQINLSLESGIYKIVFKNEEGKTHQKTLLIQK